MNLSKEKAKKLLDHYKNDTGYFPQKGDTPLSFERMWDVLYSARFGTAERNVIIAALVLAGATFTDDNNF